MKCFLLLGLLAVSCGRKDTAPAKDPVRPIDAAIDAPPFVLTGPANGEAISKAYVEAFARADEAAMRALLITPEINRAYYDCTDRPDYPVDDRIRSSMTDSLQSLAAAAKLVAREARIEIGAWSENHRAPKPAGTSVTFVCKARRDLDIVTGRLDFQIVPPDGPPIAAFGLFVLVESAGAARLASATIVEDYTTREPKPRR